MLLMHRPSNISPWQADEVSATVQLVRDLYNLDLLLIGIFSSKTVVDVLLLVIFCCGQLSRQIKYTHFDFHDRLVLLSHVGVHFIHQGMSLCVVVSYEAFIQISILLMTCNVVKTCKGMQICGHFFALL